jgi:N12 class adenine-specific DNA methylase
MLRPLAKEQQGGYGGRFSVANTTEWGTDKRSALELIEDALNLQTPTIYEHDSDKDKDVVDGPATEAARDKQEKLKDRFKKWVWQEDERRERLVRKYNDEFNHSRLRTFNGDHLTLPGASPSILLRPHQKAAVWRILRTPNCLLAHVVGAGKTYTMVAAAMELKRLGLARKPLFSVPNHMLGQFSSELLTLYPGANILVASRDDFEKEKRKTLMSRIATGNWDAVIVTHSGFEKIPVARATQEEFFKEQLRELALALEQQRKDGDSRIVKALERAKKQLETRLKELAADDRKDDGLTFEELGVDRLFVDEAHYFKNLFYVSKMTRIAGLPQTASQRAFDMFLKVLQIERINGAGGVVFATGTPIANSVAEMFTMQRFLQMGTLKLQNVASMIRVCQTIRPASSIAQSRRLSASGATQPQTVRLNWSSAIFPFRLVERAFQSMKTCAKNWSRVEFQPGKSPSFRITTATPQSWRCSATCAQAGSAFCLAERRKWAPAPTSRNA